MSVRIRLAETPEEIARCFAVMFELRPHLEPASFVEQVIRQQAEGYRLAFLEDAAGVQACAGYRMTESLSWGRFMYVDDLVTASSARSRGFGGELLDWLVAQARAAGCVQFHLDSGVQRFGAHRFYLQKRMDIIAHHFALKL
ncbi:MAG: GNAT family N-acetyltransferase [Chthoniobacter sp.]|nr:GNAT family N-acetyltransferase [Chthoniobacter sp.]